MFKLSESEKHRAKGNEYYKSSKDEGLAPTVRIKRLDNSIKHYYTAFNRGWINDDKASALKNLAKANFEKTKYLNDKSFSEKKLVQFQFEEALEHVMKAIKTGKTCKSEEWLQKIKLEQSDCLAAACDFASIYPLQKRLGLQEKFGMILNDDQIMAETFLNIGRLLFQHAVVSLEKDEFKACLSALDDCYRPIQEIFKLTKDDESMQAEARVLQSDVQMQAATAKSMQAVATGDDLLNIVMNDTENLHMGMVMDIIDWYGQAILLVRNLELEREAIACCRLGDVFSRVLKMKERAKKHYKHCLNLGIAMAPRVVTNLKWYQTATAAIQLYQQESVLLQDTRDRAAKEKYLEMYKDELKEIQKIFADYGPKKGELLIRIYAAYPPKNKNHVIPARDLIMKMGHPEIKKLFLKACVHYHPDKQDVEKYGEGWKVFSGEIAKYFTCDYQNMKGVD